MILGGKEGKVDEQQVLLNLLPQLTEAETQSLFERLEADHQAMAETLQTAHVKRDTILLDFEAQLKNPATESEEN